jgi:tRNA (guanine10-N2)-dimethyltransferase
MAGDRPLPCVYVLELAGQDDAFAAREAASAASDVTLVGAGVATARGLSDRISHLAFTRRASALLGRTDPAVDSARALCRVASVERTGSVRVRAVDVRTTTGVDTQRAERALGDVLVDRGFTVDLDDPDHELRALFAGPPDAADGAGDDGEAGGVCLLGWLTAESDRGFTARQPTDRPFFQPGGMDPMLARALVNLAGGHEGEIVLDPMCGTGGVLIEAGRVGAQAVGVDAQEKMTAGASENLADTLEAPFTVLRGDARRLPLAADVVDAAVFDVPYGRQSKIAGAQLATLVADALAEAARVADRAVVVGDRDWSDAARDAGWTVTDRFERRVHRSLVRHVHVLR